MEMLKRARSESCWDCDDAGDLKVLIKNGIAPDDPMICLFESSALRPRKLATIASEIGGGVFDLMRFTILWTAPAFTIAALLLKLQEKN